MQSAIKPNLFRQISMIKLGSEITQKQSRVQKYCATVKLVCPDLNYLGKFG